MIHPDPARDILRINARVAHLAPRAMSAAAIALRATAARASNATQNPTYNRARMDQANAAARALENGRPTFENSPHSAQEYREAAEYLSALANDTARLNHDMRLMYARAAQYALCYARPDNQPAPDSRGELFGCAPAQNC